MNLARRARRPRFGCNDGYNIPNRHFRSRFPASLYQNWPRSNILRGLNPDALALIDWTPLAVGALGELSLLRETSVNGA